MTDSSLASGPYSTQASPTASKSALLLLVPAETDDLNALGLDSAMTQSTSALLLQSFVLVIRGVH